MKRAVIFPTNGQAYEVDLGTDTLTTLKNAVGGWIEPVELGSPWTMWVNEEGKLKQLAVNDKATQMFNEGLHEVIDLIVGNVIFTGGTTPTGATKGLTDKSVKYLLEY